MNPIKLLIVFAVVFLFNGCASIVSGTDQTMTFNTEPDGATVIISGRTVGKTPLSLKLDKGKNQSLSFELEGYKPFTTQLSTTTDGWFWGNIMIGGFIGSTTDGMSGAIYEFSPDQYFISLAPLAPFSIPGSRPLQIKEIVVAFGDELRLELVNGGGEKTKALLVLLGAGGSDDTTKIGVLKKLASKEEDDLELAKSIISFYGVE